MLLSYILFLLYISFVSATNLCIPILGKELCIPNPFQLACNLLCQSPRVCQIVNGFPQCVLPTTTPPRRCTLNCPWPSVCAFDQLGYQRCFSQAQTTTSRPCPLPYCTYPYACVWIVGSPWCIEQATTPGPPCNLVCVAPQVCRIVQGYPRCDLPPCECNPPYVCSYRNGYRYCDPPGK